MNKVWIILKSKTITGENYSPTEIETSIGKTYEEGIEKFNSKAKDLMDSFKESFSKAHNIDIDKSFKECRKIGASKSEFYDFGYSEYLSDGKIFSIRAEKINENKEIILEEDVLILYSYNFEKESSVQLMTLNDNSKEVDFFYETIR